MNTSARKTNADKPATPAAKSVEKPVAPTAPAAPTAPVAPVAKPEEKKTTAPVVALDLSTLTVEADEAPRRVGGAGRHAEDNSVAEKWIRDSWAGREGEKPRYGKGLGVTVPIAAVGTLKSRLNRAAVALKLGVTIAVDEDKAKGTARVRFAAKVRKAPRKSDAAPTTGDQTNNKLAA